MNIPRPVASFQQNNPTGPYIMTFAPGLIYSWFAGDVTALPVFRVRHVGV